MPKFTFHKPLYYFGWAMLLLSLFLIVNIPSNQEIVLGINSLIKPLKFSLSTWIYAWTMAILLNFLEDKSLLRKFTWIIIIILSFEQVVITIQAWNGQLSHFNDTSLFSAILFMLMGVFITFLTFYTLFVAIKFQKQTDNLPSAFKLSIVLGLVIFVIGSFLGGVMGGLNSHQIGGEMGENGLPFLNWSTKFGDLRIAHFMGIHSLQIIPLFGYFVTKRIYNENSIKLYITVFSTIFFGIIMFLFVQAMLGLPLIAI